MYYFVFALFLQQFNVQLCMSFNFKLELITANDYIPIKFLGSTAKTKNVWILYNHDSLRAFCEVIWNSQPVEFCMLQSDSFS